MATEFTLKNRSRVSKKLREEVINIVKRYSCYERIFAERERIKFYVIMEKKPHSINSLIKKLKKEKYVEQVCFGSSSYCRYRPSLLVYFKKEFQINKGVVSIC